MMNNAEVDILVAAGKLDAQTADLIRTLNNAKTATARGAKSSERKTPGQPKVILEVVVTAPKAGQEAFTPYKRLHVHNGNSGRFYHGAYLNAAQLAAIKAWTGSLA